MRNFAKLQKTAKSQNFAKAMQEVTGSAFRDADGRERSSLKIFS